MIIEKVKGITFYCISLIIALFTIKDKGFDLYVYLCLLICFSVMLFCIILYICKFIRLVNKYKKKVVILFAFLIIPIVIAAVTKLLSTNLIVSSRKDILIAILILTILSVFIYKRFIVFATDLCDEINNLDEINAIEAANDKMLQGYKRILEQKKRISVIRHDIANQIQVMKKLAVEKNDLAKKMYDEMLNSIDNSAQYKYCDNSIIDIALEQKISKLQSMNCNISTEIKMKNTQKCEYTDICSIINMMFDTVCEYIIDNKDIVFRMSIINNKDNIRNIKIMISYAIDKKNKKKILRDSYTKSINNCVKNNNGSCICDYNAGLYTMACMLEVMYV